MESARSQPDISIELEGFKNIPSLLEVPVPPSYAVRLKTIHAAATKQIYGSEGIITTTETPEGKYEAYITLADQTHKYREIPLQNAGTIQTIATYQSLRHVANVLGYKIVDLNYPTLAMLVSAINKSCVNAATNQSENIYQSYLQVQTKLTPSNHTSDHICKVHSSIRQLMTVAEDHREAVTNYFHEFMECKIQYISTYAATEYNNTRPMDSHQ